MGEPMGENHGFLGRFWYLSIYISNVIYIYTYDINIVKYVYIYIYIHSNHISRNLIICFYHAFILNSMVNNFYNISLGLLKDISWKLS